MTNNDKSVSAVKKTDKKTAKEGTINAKTFANSIGKSRLANQLVKANEGKHYATLKDWTKLLKKIGG